MRHAQGVVAEPASEGAGIVAQAAKAASCWRVTACMYAPEDKAAYQSAVMATVRSKSSIGHQPRLSGAFARSSVRSCVSSGAASMRPLPSAATWAAVT